MAAHQFVVDGNMYASHSGTWCSQHGFDSSPACASNSSARWSVKHTCREVIDPVVLAERCECVEGFSKPLVSRKVKTSVPFSKA
jgi:hypothetical protein